ncbi:hypothetical protein Vretimale_5280 [Volvox reticuliferus]|uniref:tRNA (adenine(58)-N(1))-methyltransferase non-catalytic subunit TRM6 n=2 Tax=Volvox reticuliferus TaxID=1737510 RepID=A0A8J4G5J0_9CHLO|nr:hypothetical protein Vretifemale_3633 [Volvox reticuliferus]GIM00468.1 hypothetical protein Vretimale_5280 [Volvox reticuliferus]
MAADGVICEGDHVVLDVNGEKMMFVQKLKTSSKVRIGKFFLAAAPLIGAPYGALFEVTSDGKTLQRVLLPPDDGITRITETEKNNSGLFDRNDENQKLTQEQIEELKKSGKAGTEIIEALISNSATFQNKTEFSQDKYKKRKAKKYLTYVTVLKPTSRIVSQAYYDKTPEKFPCMRPDTLAVMLSLANVAAGAKVLVADRCQGVLTAAAVERLGGEGAVCAVEMDGRPAVLDAVRQMNLSIAQRSVLFTAPAGHLLREKQLQQQHEKKQEEDEPQSAVVAKDSTTSAVDAATSPMAAAPVAARSEAFVPAQSDTAMEDTADEGRTDREEGETGDGGCIGDATAAAGSCTAVKEEVEPQGQQRGGYGSFRARPEQVHSVLKSGFDSVLVALPNVHPTTVLAIIWPLLAPSATFAIFAPWSQPLAEALTHLQYSRNAVMLMLQESWLRPYQVLPSRTHPHMACAGTGGYILSGIKVIPPDATPLELQVQNLYPKPVPLDILQPQPFGQPLSSQQQQQQDNRKPAVEDADDAAEGDQVGEDGWPASEEGREGEQAVAGKREAAEGHRGRWGGRGSNGGNGRNWRGRGRGFGGGGKRKFDDGADDKPDRKRQAK